MAGELEKCLEEMVRRIVREELERLSRAEEDRFLTVLDAAEHVSVSVSTVRRWIADGSLPSFGGGRLLRVRRSDLGSCLTPRSMERPEPMEDLVSRFLDEEMK